MSLPLDVGDSVYKIGFTKNQSPIIHQYEVKEIYKLNGNGWYALISPPKGTTLFQEDFDISNRSSYSIINDQVFGNIFFPRKDMAIKKMLTGVWDSIHQLEEEIRKKKNRVNKLSDLYSAVVALSGPRI